MEADYIFTAGRRYPQQAADTVKAYRHVPYFEFESGEDLLQHLPRGTLTVAVEQHRRSKPLSRFVHPERACYILGAEDTGVPKRILERCNVVVDIPAIYCLNVAVAGSIVLYDRNAKRGAVAQSVERLVEAQEVAGSTPVRTTSTETIFAQA
jgi:tRNA G18 (ribose-2'-O)-methylase SpoU